MKSIRSTSDLRHVASVGNNRAHRAAIRRAARPPEQVYLGAGPVPQSLCHLNNNPTDFVVVRTTVALDGLRRRAMPKLSLQVLHFELQELSCLCARQVQMHISTAAKTAHRRRVQELAPVGLQVPALSDMDTTAAAFSSIWTRSKTFACLRHIKAQVDARTSTR
jgi:hypothetical protein